MIKDQLTLDCILDFANCISDSPLTSLTGENAFEPLLTLLFSSQLAFNHQIDEYYRIVIANCLLKLNEPIAKPLFDYLQYKPRILYKKEFSYHQKYERRFSLEAVIEILGSLDDKSVVPGLLEILREINNRQLIQCILRTLVTAKNEEGIRGLTEIMLSPEEPMALRKIIARTLGDFPHHLVEIPLIFALKYGHRDVVMEVLRSLGKIQSKFALTFLLESLLDIRQLPFLFGNYSQIEILLDTIQSFHNKESNKIILDWCSMALKDNDSNLTLEAVKRVAILQDDRAIPILVNALNNIPENPPPLTDTIHKALQEIGTPEALSALADWQQNNP